MAKQGLSRKLAVIVHADVVGSSTLVRRDETLAHARINEAFQRFSSVIQAYGGVAREIRGDALVAEFARASDAVCAALKFQQLNAAHNARLDDGVVPVVRVGIALGEEVIANHTVTGSGVVLAQRVEQLSEPGGVYVTSAIHEAIPRRMPFDQESLGEREVKGFEEAIRVYRVALKAGEAVPKPEIAKSTRGPSKQRRLFAASAALLLIIAGSLVFSLNPWAPEEQPAWEGQKTFPLSDKPSIAVLPFANMSDDPSQEYFVDGMTEDLITDLSKVSGLLVIARNSTFAYKGKPKNVRSVAEELGVRYVLEGSVRRSGDRLRINAQLIDATSGMHVWADRYDGALNDVFALQDSVTRKIVSVLAVHLTKGEQQQLTRRGTESPQAYDAFLRGWDHYLRQTPDDFRQAVAHFKEAIEVDPEYGLAYAALAATHWQVWKRYWHESLGFTSYHNPRAEAEKFLEQAIRRPTPLAHQVNASMLTFAGRHEDAIVEAEKAIALDPNNADSYVALAGAYNLVGLFPDALQVMERAMRLNPHYPSFYLYEVGLAQFGARRYEQAAATLERAIALNPFDRYSYRLVAAIYGLLDRTQDAARVLEVIQERDARGSQHYFDPISVRSSAYWHPFKHRDHAERFAEGLRRAGVPE